MGRESHCSEHLDHVRAASLGSKLSLLTEAIPPWELGDRREGQGTHH